MRNWLLNSNVKTANEMAAFSSNQKYAMKDAVDREGLNCEFDMRRSYDVYIDEGDAKQAEDLYRTAVREGHRWARDFDFVDGEFAEQVWLNRYIFPCLNTDQKTGHFHPRCKSRNQHASLQPLALQIRHTVTLQACRLWYRNSVHPHTHPLHNPLIPLSHSSTHSPRQHHHQETDLCHKCLHTCHLSSL